MDLEKIEFLFEEILREIEPAEQLRKGIIDTPRRVAKMYAEIFSGYAKDGKEFLERTFGEEDEVLERYKGMVIVRPIPFYSVCEHHLALFQGVAVVGYIPDEIVVGLSKLARLTKLYSRRLQVQERLTEQITNDIVKYLKPKGVMVVMEATHSCMSARGAECHGARTITSSVRGVFEHNDAARAEFLSLVALKLVP